MTTGSRDILLSRELGEGENMLDLVSASRLKHVWCTPQPWLVTREGVFIGDRGHFSPQEKGSFPTPISRMPYSLLGSAESSSCCPVLAQQIPSCPQACVRAGFQPPKEAHASQEAAGGH